MTVVTRVQLVGIVKVKSQNVSLEFIDFQIFVGGVFVPPIGSSRSESKL